MVLKNFLIILIFAWQSQEEKDMAMGMGAVYAGGVDIIKSVSLYWSYSV